MLTTSLALIKKHHAQQQLVAVGPIGLTRAATRPVSGKQFDVIPLQGRQFPTPGGRERLGLGLVDQPQPHADAGDERDEVQVIRRPLSLLV